MSLVMGRGLICFRLWVPIAICALVCGFAPEARAAEYHVGPGQQFTSIGQVRWYDLKAGDTVYIHWRNTPYREKILISSQGTASEWIRILGVPGPSGELPVISGDGATTSTNMHWRWQNPADLQNLGVISIAVSTNDGNGSPAYIEIANLQVQDGYKAYSFTAENGQVSTYNGFAACIYARSPRHLLVRNNVLTNCGQGFYNWTGGERDGPWWSSLAYDVTLRANYFYNNGNPGSYTEHQSYTEADGVVYEFNYFGPSRPGAIGSQLKDRSSGTVIRYNFIDGRAPGWKIDLVEPENGYDGIATTTRYKQTFVYGNIIYNKTAEPNLIHWNEDHYAGVGRATVAGSKLLFYHNTVLSIANQSDIGWDVPSSRINVFNEHLGGYDCPGANLPGRIDIRNNIFAFLPRTAGSPVPHYRFSYCKRVSCDFGSNWVSPDFELNCTQTTGTTELFSPANNQPGFVDPYNEDVHLSSGSSALAIGGALAAEVTQNFLGQNLAPVFQYFYHGSGETRPEFGAGSDAGALERGDGTPPPPPSPTPTPTQSPTPTATPTSTPTPAAINVTLLEPTDGQVLRRSIRIRSVANGSLGVRSVGIFVNGAPVKACTKRRPRTSLSCSHRIRRPGAGSYDIAVVGTDAAGNTAQRSARVSVAR